MICASLTRDQHPKEVFVHHLAGVGGVGGDGGGLPMDFVAFRDREQPNPNPPADNWPAAAGARLDERTYLCQNWRGDVVAVFSREGFLVNQMVSGQW